MIAKKPAKDTEKLTQDNHDVMTYSALANIHVHKDAESKHSYDQLVNPEDDSASEVAPSGQESKNLVVTYSDYSKNNVGWRKDTKDDFTSTYRQVLNSGFTTMLKDARMLYDKDPMISKNTEKGDRWDWAMVTNENYHRYKELKRQLDILENPYFANYNRGPVGSRDPRKVNGHFKIKNPYTIYKDLYKQQQLLYRKYSKEYERDMEIQSEITYSALKKQIAMANDKETKDLFNLYKTLNRNFKKSNTEDFFREPVAACVEVLEYISAWIAEKLSLPPPDPVNHDVVIYKREDKSNYSYLGSVIRNKKAQFLVSRGVPFNDTESFGYMFLNQ